LFFEKGIRTFFRHSRGGKKKKRKQSTPPLAITSRGPILANRKKKGKSKKKRKRLEDFRMEAVVPIVEKRGKGGEGGGGLWRGLSLNSQTPGRWGGKRKGGGGKRSKRCLEKPMPASAGKKGRGPLEKLERPEGQGKKKKIMN